MKNLETPGKTGRVGRYALMFFIHVSIILPVSIFILTVCGQGSAIKVFTTCLLCG